MNLHSWVTLITCAAEAAFALIALMRGSRSPLMLPLTLLCVVLFAWNFFALAYEVSGVLTWRWLDISASPLTAPLVLHLVLVFTGRLRAFRWVLAASYAMFALLSLTSLLAIYSPNLLHGFAGSPTWAITHVIAVTVVMSFGLNLVRIHLDRASPEEQDRTRLLLLAGLTLTAFAVTELLADLGVPSVPRLGNVGTLAFSGLVAAVAFRLRVFERELTTSVLVYALVLASIGTLAYLAVFQFFGTNVAMLLLGTATVTFALLAAARQTVSMLSGRRARMQQLATLGRFSAQMAHDLKNPLAALKGATQFLHEERAQGRPLSSHEDFLDLITEQIDRLERVVDRYQRLGRVEPMASSLDVNDVVRRVLALQPFATDGKVAVYSDLTEKLPDCRADRDLLAGALENMIRNAFEAMPNGGTLTVRTALRAGNVVLVVEDSGHGMDARTRERAFDAFYTTKPNGSGLGLAFVRRVAEAHGGDVALTSKEGSGTTLELRLPLEGPA